MWKLSISSLIQGSVALWNLAPFPRDDTSSSGNAHARPGRRSLNVNGALGLVLHYLNSTILELNLQEIPPTVSRYIAFGLEILLNILRRIPDSRIQWPRTQQQFENYTNLIMARHPWLHGAFGIIDGLNLMVETADDIDVENATYNGWLFEHFISSVLVFAPDEDPGLYRSQNLENWRFLSGRLLAILSGLELAVFKNFKICPDQETAFSRPQICPDRGNSPSRGLKFAGRLPKSFY
jgi:hypothetical protein